MFHSLEFSANYIKKIKYDRRQSKRSPENFFMGTFVNQFQAYLVTSTAVLTQFIRLAKMHLTMTKCNQI